jgi:endonuclease III
MRSNRLAWYGHIMRRDESHITKREMTINVDGHAIRGRPRKRWMDCMKDDMEIKRASMEMTSDRREWRIKHVMPIQHSGIRGQ